MRIRLTNFIKKLFREEPKLIITRTQQLPEIDERKPLVVTSQASTPKLYYNENQTAAQETQIQKSCAVCKFAVHDENLEDLKSILCTVDPNKPGVKANSETCSQHISKYPNLKVFVDNDNLMEYDSANNNPNKDRAKTLSIGEEQWQL